jgi:hypothetical protein
MIGLRDPVKVVLAGMGGVTGPTPPSASGVQSVAPLFSTQDIMVDGETFSPNTPGDYHTVVVAKDEAGDVAWKVHIKSQASQQMNHVRPLYGDYILHPDGYVIVPFFVYVDSATSKVDSAVDITPFGGATTTITTRCIEDTNQFFAQWCICRINLDGTVEWASAAFSIDDNTYSGQGYYNQAADFVDIDGTKFACLMSCRQGGSGIAVARTATFMPDSDGTFTQALYQGEMWEVEVNYADGTVVAQPERWGLEVYRAGGGNNISLHNSGPSNYGHMAVNGNGRRAIAMTHTTNVWNGIGDGYQYRAGSSPGYPFTEGAPSPGYPTNVRWEKRQISTNSEAAIMVREANGDFRFNMQFGSSIPTTGPYPVGVEAIPSTDDWLLSLGMPVGFGGTIRNRFDSPEVGAYEPVADNGSSGGGAVQRWDDNAGTPWQPTRAFQLLFSHGQGEAAPTTAYMLQQAAIDPNSDRFVAGFVSNAVGVSWRKQTGHSVMSLKAQQNHGAPSNYNAFLASAQHSDGENRWVAEIESTNQVIGYGSPVFKGREVWVTMWWLDAITIHHWTIAQVQAGGTLNANAAEFSLTEAGSHVDIFRFDISTGEYKGRIPIAADLVNSNLGVYGTTVRTGVANIQSDLADDTASIGIAFSSTAPTVLNATGAVTFSNEGDDLAPTGLTFNASTGQVEGTATGGAGTYDIVVKATDSVGDFSYSNRWTLTVS